LNEYQKSELYFCMDRAATLPLQSFWKKGISSVTIALPADGGVQEVTIKMGD